MYEKELLPLHLLATTRSPGSWNLGSAGHPLPPPILKVLTRNLAPGPGGTTQGFLQAITSSQPRGCTCRASGFADQKNRWADEQSKPLLWRRRPQPGEGRVLPSAPGAGCLPAFLGKADPTGCFACHYSLHILEMDAA